MDNDKKFDELLDKALADYSNAEPRAGLEDRIIVRLDERRASAAAGPDRAWLRWWPALGLAAAAIIAAIFLAVPKQASRQDVVKQIAPPAQSDIRRPLQSARSSAIPTTMSSPRHLASRVPAGHIIAKPDVQMAVMKQDVFPAPAPLTVQEQMLLAYLRRTPSTEIVMQAKPDEVPDVFQPQNRVQLARPSDSNLGK